MRKGKGEGTDSGGKGRNWPMGGTEVGLTEGEGEGPGRGGRRKGTSRGGKGWQRGG